MSGASAGGEAGRVGRHEEGLYREPARRVVPITELSTVRQRQASHAGVGKGPGYRQDVRVLFQNGSHRIGGVQVQRSPFSKQHDAERMIELGIGEGDALHWTVAHIGWQGPGKTGKLLPDIRGRVQQEPAFAIGTDRRRGLGPGLCAMRLHASCPTGGTPTVPLRKATTRRGTKEKDAHAKKAGLAEASPLLRSGQSVATYAVTSMVTATISASGLVHVMVCAPNEGERLDVDPRHAVCHQKRARAKDLSRAYAGG
jgi:hypothetical protein